MSEKEIISQVRLYPHLYSIVVCLYAKEWIFANIKVSQLHYLSDFMSIQMPMFCSTASKFLININAMCNWAFK